MKMWKKWCLVLGTVVTAFLGATVTPIGERFGTVLLSKFDQKTEKTATEMVSAVDTAQSSVTEETELDSTTKTESINNNSYEIIDKLTTDVQVSYYDKLLGTPAIIKPWWSEEFPNYNQYIYVNDDYFVKTIADESNTVLYYAVTTRKQDFNPNLPSVFGKELKLGKTKINDINAEPENISLNASSKFEYYQESYYFGNPGNYGSYLIGGYSPSEYSQDFYESKYSIFEIVIMEKDEEIKDRKTQVLRKNLVPNTYGVISGSASPEFKEQIIQSLEMSIDFFDTIKFRQ